MDNHALDIVQVVVRDLIDARERRREKVLELVRKNRARRRGVKCNWVLQDFAGGAMSLWRESDSLTLRRSSQT